MLSLDRRRLDIECLEDEHSRLNAMSSDIEDGGGGAKSDDGGGEVRRRVLGAFEFVQALLTFVSHPVGCELPSSWPSRSTSISRRSSSPTASTQLRSRCRHFHTCMCMLHPHSSVGGHMIYTHSFLTRILSIDRLVPAATRRSPQKRRRPADRSPSASAAPPGPSPAAGELPELATTEQDIKVWSHL